MLIFINYKLISPFLWNNSPTRTTAASFLNFLGHKQHTKSAEFLWRDRLVADTSTWQNTTLTSTDIHVPGEIRTRKKNFLQNVRTKPPTQGVLGALAAGAWNWILTPSSSDVKNSWNTTFTLTYVLQYCIGTFYRPLLHYTWDDKIKKDPQHTECQDRSRLHLVQDSVRRRNVVKSLNG